MTDVIIIGAGPAGITAALYISRAGFDVTVIAIPGGSLSKAEKIENFYGFPEPLSGQELYQRGIEGAKRLGVKFIESEAVGIGFTDKLTVKTTNGDYSADALIIATGTTRRKPSIKNLKEYEGRGVSYCAVCDAFFHKGRDVAVLGNSSYALHEATELFGLAASVTLLTNGEKPEISDKRLKINTKKIDSLFGNDLLEGVIFEDKTTLDISGLFVALGTAGSADLARKIGVATNGEKIIVDDETATNIPGIFAAGDCTGGLLQISKASYEGTKAGISVINYLRKKNTAK